MALRRGYPARVHSSSRRVNKWGIGPQLTLTNATSSGNLFFTTGVALAAESQVTIIRLRGEFLAFLTAAGAAEGFSGAVGIGICTDEAFAAGVTAVPGPVDESDWDGWMWHSFFHVFEGFSAAGDGSVIQSIRLPVDSKAMRKFSAGYTLFGTVQLDEIGTATIQIACDTRTLLKLS